MIHKVKRKSQKVKPSNLTVPVDYSLDVQGLSQSLVLTFQECRRKFLMQLNGYRASGKNKTYLFGNIMHGALDKCYNSAKLIDFSVFEKEFRSQNADELIDVEEQQLERDFAIAETMLPIYFENYEDDLTKKKFEAVEEEFCVYFHGVKLRGKKDGLFTINGKRWLMEHKTKGRIQEDPIMLKLSFDFQNLLYILADELEHKETIAGTLYNVIRNPQIKQGKQTLEAFCQRVAADMRERPKFYFMRWEVPYTANDKKRFAIELTQKLDDIKRALETNTCYKSENACVGLYSCDFLSACAADSFANLTRSANIFPELACAVADVF